MSDFPITHIYDLGNLAQAGAEVHIALKEDASKRVAAWAGVNDVENFLADIDLKKLSLNRFELEVRWSADVVQSCVVTLDPVTSHLRGQFIRELNLIRRPRRTPVASEEIVSASDKDVDEEPELIDNPHYDLAIPVLEDFMLAIDPYPRKQGVEFAVAEEPADKPESPFAALKSLKIDR